MGKQKYFSHVFSSMSTEIEFKLFSAAGTIEINEAIAAAQEEFFRIGRTYTRFDQTSLLSKLNKSGYQENLPLELLNLVEFMLELSRFSGGKFDPTVIDLLEIHGYKSTFNPKTFKPDIVKLRDLPGYAQRRANWQQVELNWDNRSIKLSKGLRLDLGGVGKGYAIDCAAAKLASVSENFLISAGGDIFCRGRNLRTASSWLLELKIMEGPQKFRHMEIIANDGDTALASSGSWARSVGKFHHLLNPTTGEPESANVQSFVLRQSAAGESSTKNATQISQPAGIKSYRHALVADGLATVLFLEGPSSLDRINATYACEGMLVSSSGRYFASDNFPVLQSSGATMD